MNTRTIIFSIFLLSSLMIVLSTFYVESKDKDVINIKGMTYKLEDRAFDSDSKNLEHAIINKYPKQLAAAKKRGYISIDDAVNFGVDNPKLTRMSINVANPSKSNGLEFFVNATSIELYGPILSLPRNINYLENLNIIKVYGGNNCHLNEFPDSIVGTKIKELSIYKCQFNSLNQEIFAMPQLHTLSIVDGNLSEVIIKTENNVLENLNLKGNNLSKLPRDINLLLNLKQISLENNPIALDE